MQRSRFARGGGEWQYDKWENIPVKDCRWSVNHANPSFRTSFVLSSFSRWELCVGNVFPPPSNIDFETFFYWVFFFYFLDSDAILQCAHLHKQIQSMTALVKWGNCARRVNMSCFLFFLESKSSEGVCVTKAGLESKTPTRQRRSPPTGPKSWCHLAWRFLVFSEQAALWGNTMIGVFFSKHCHQAAPQAASQGNPSWFLPNNTRNLATEAVKKKKKNLQLGNLPWKASFASHDFLSEVFGFGICIFQFDSRWEKTNSPLLPKSPSYRPKNYFETIRSGGAQMLAKCISLRFLWRLDGVLLTVSVTPGCR